MAVTRIAVAELTGPKPRALVTGRLSRLALVAVCVIAAKPASAQSSVPWIDLDVARRAFDDVRAACQKDGGRLWGVSLCGPTMFADRDSHVVVANCRPGPTGAPCAPGFFVTTSPLAEMASNHAENWAGLWWTQVMWPLTGDSEARRILLLHESFHRVQNTSGWAQGTGETAAHLDTLEGRYSLLLEWRALARALESRGAQRRVAIEDAMLFRRARRARFEKAAAVENELERMEGLAEYTGIKIGAEGPERQRAVALERLRRHAKEPSLVRSFQYASGPAYGILLDEAGVEWRKAAPANVALDLGALLRASLGLTDAVATTDLVAARAKVYDDGSLRAAEEARDRATSQKAAVLTQKLVRGPVLTIPYQGASISFDPRAVVPLGEFGAVHPSARVRGPWGMLIVNEDVLLDPPWHTATVAGPVSGGPSSWRGEGWTLELEDGWSIVPGPREGDRQVVGGPPDGGR